MRFPKQPDAYWRCEKCKQRINAGGGHDYCPQRKRFKGHKPVLYQPPDDRPMWVRAVEGTAQALGSLNALLLVVAFVAIVFLAWVVIAMAIEGDGPHCSVATVSEDC
jgi:hypothetical protein